MFSQAQFQQGMKIGQCRFRTLILVGAIGVQAVPATASRRVIHGQIQVVAPAEPIEGPAGFFAPARVPGDSVRFEAGGHRGLGLDGLLIETGTLATLPIEAVRSDRYKMPTLLCALYVG